MSTGHTAGDPTGAGPPASEEELRAAYEAEIKKVRVEHVLLEQVVSLINLGMRRTGLAPGTEDERDLGQVRLAIESIRVLMPLIEQSAAAQAGPIRDALSQLQLAFVRLGGAPGPGVVAAGSPGAPGGPTGVPAPGAPGGAPGAPAADRPGQPGAGTGSPGAPPEPGSEDPKPGDAGPAQRSGRLWVPGQ